MGWQFPPYAAVLGLGILILVFLAYVSWQKREMDVARRFFYVNVTFAAWIAVSTLTVLQTDLAGQLFLDKVKMTVVGPAIIANFLFVLEYTGYEKYITKRSLAALSVEPLLVAVAAWTNPIHQQFYSSVATGEVATRLLGTTFGPYTVLETTPGLGRSMHLLYTYVLVLVGGYLLVKFALSAQHLYQQQATAMLVAGVVPFAASVVSFLGLNPFPGIELTELGFVITAILFAWGVFAPQFLDLVPIAREAIIEEMNDGVMVLDPEYRVVDINPLMRQMLAIRDEQIVGKHVRDILPGSYGLFEQFADREEANEVIQIPTDETVRYFEVTISPLIDQQGQLTGRLVIAHDITDRKQYERELERQNEHLDKFASVVSHDLRNPLTIADSRLKMAEETGEQEHFEKARHALERIDQIADDVLTLAREGQSVTDLEPTPLAPIVEEAWENVETSDATLTVDLSITAPTDRDRLLQVFENLFRNAVEHGDNGVSIRVESFEAEDDRGIAIGDDGPGIPDDIEDKIFEYGFTGSDGTGFGLAIVQTIVEAHGWEITVADAGTPFEPTDGDTATHGLGGAHFAITGLPPDDPTDDTDGESETENPTTENAD